MTTYDELEARWQRYTAAIARANESNKASIFAALVTSGVTQIVVGFDGEGDSGQIDGAAAFKGGQAVDFPNVSVSIIRAQSRSDKVISHDVPLREAVEELCYSYLEQRHGGWENNDGAFGEFTLLVTERRITLEFNARFVDSSQTNHTF